MAGAQEGISATNQQFMQGFAGGDAEAIARCYTAEAQLFPAHSDVVSGTAAITAFWQGAFSLGYTGARLETAEIEEHGDTAIEYGTYLLSAGHAKADRGKYVVIWKNDGGTWKLHRDIWNTSQPAE
jgi:ketosteroid isomerase-like protein